MGMSFSCVTCDSTVPAKVVSLFSGGKDSTLALTKALETGFSVESLLTVIPRNPESWMFHYPCVELTKYQSKALEIPLTRVETTGEKEKELMDLNDALADLKTRLSIDGVVSGAIASTYQKSRIDNLCRNLGLESFTPLWGANPRALLDELLMRNFEVVFTSVSAYGLTERWLGRKLDQTTVLELEQLQQKYGVHPSLEGGEGETFVLDCPLFKQRIHFRNSKKIWNGDSGFLIVDEVGLSEKP